jgi:CheY-like chemotaxis protein
MKRISAVAAELRRFSRVEAVLMQSVDLREVVASALALTGTELRQRCRLVVSHHSGEVPVIGVVGKLTQVVTNLLVNASQALGRPESDVIEITTALDGADVVLAVTDTGCGMSPEVCNRVFQPFFTTRSRDDATGLGLSICADIMQQHGGSISVRSTPDVGTTFELRIAADRGCEVTPSVLAAVTPRKRVLVVDDEPNMLRAYRRLLSNYDVVSAPGGAEALELIAADGRFDFVICDLTMPGVDGGAVYRFICDKAPHLRSRIAICTGGAVTASARELLETIEAPVVFKPVDIDELLSLIEGARPIKSIS